jgi:predicted nucleic acid-binding protein
MTFVDTNVIIDILSSDAVWSGWSVERLSDARRDGSVRINAIILAELSRNYASLADLDAALSILGPTSEPIDDRTAFLAGQRFIAYRESRGVDKTYRVLPDFFIGAHALTFDAPLLTRDPAHYRRYFPELTLITPETDQA